MHREELEHIISGKYVGATNFVWDTHGTAFDFESILQEDHPDMVAVLETSIVAMQKTISELSGRLYQAERDYKIALRNANWREDE